MEMVQKGCFHLSRVASVMAKQLESALVSFKSLCAFGRMGLRWQIRSQATGNGGTNDQTFNFGGRGKQTGLRVIVESLWEGVGKSAGLRSSPRF